MRWILAGILAATMAVAATAQTERSAAGQWAAVRVGAATVSVPSDWVLKEETETFSASPRAHTRQLPSGETEFDLAVMGMRFPRQGKLAGVTSAEGYRILQEYFANEFGAPTTAPRPVTVGGHPATQITYPVPGYPNEEQQIRIVDAPQSDELLVLITAGQPQLIRQYAPTLERMYAVQFAAPTQSTPQAATGPAPRVVCRTSLRALGASTIVSCGSMKIEHFDRDRFVLRDMCHGLEENFEARVCDRGNVNGSNGVLPHYDYASMPENEWVTPMSFRNANLPIRARRAADLVTFEGLSTSDMSLRRLTAVGDSAIEHSRLVDSPLAAATATALPAGWTPVTLGRVTVGVPARWETVKTPFFQPPPGDVQRGRQPFGTEFYAITQPGGDGYLFGWRKPEWVMDHSTLRFVARQHALDLANLHDLDPIEPLVEVKDRHGVEMAYTLYHARDRSTVMVATVFDTKTVYWFMFFKPLENEPFIERVLNTVSVAPLIGTVEEGPKPAPVMLEGVWENQDSGVSLVIGPSQTQGSRVMRPFTYTTTNDGTKGNLFERGDTLMFGSQSCTQKRQNDVFLGFHVLTLDCQSGGPLPGYLRLNKNIPR